MCLCWSVSWSQSACLFADHHCMSIGESTPVCLWSVSACLLIIARLFVSITLRLFRSHHCPSVNHWSSVCWYHCPPISWSSLHSVGESLLSVDITVRLFHDHYCILSMNHCSSVCWYHCPPISWSPLHSVGKSLLFCLLISLSAYFVITIAFCWWITALLFVDITVRLFGDHHCPSVAHYIVSLFWVFFCLLISWCSSSLSVDHCPPICWSSRICLLVERYCPSVPCAHTVTPPDRLALLREVFASVREPWLGFLYFTF